MKKRKKDKQANDLLKPIGGPQICPKCGLNNPSGRKLPKKCQWCNGTKNIKKPR